MRNTLRRFPRRFTERGWVAGVHLAEVAMSRKKKMRSIVTRILLFCGLTVVSAAALAIPYLNI
jgi:hypothetical protein